MLDSISYFVSAILGLLYPLNSLDVERFLFFKAHKLGNTLEKMGSARNQVTIKPYIVAFNLECHDCARAQCYTCESECPVQAIRVVFGGAHAWQKAILLTMFAQIFGGILYGTIFGPYLGLKIPLYVGWLVTMIGLPFFLATAIYFPRKGKPQEGKSSMDVTAVVDTGLYGIVRHPQYLGCISMMFASILVSQHWLSAIIGVPIALWIYSEIPKEEKGLILKFGDDYRRYMEKVPRLNPIVGFIRLLRERRS